MAKNKPEVWTCTDPDNYQYGRKTADGVYEFKEFDKLNFAGDEHGHEEEKTFVTNRFSDSDFWVEETIDLNQYSQKDKEKAISGYYDSMEALSEICKGDMEQVSWIVAECIFEQNSGLY